MTLIFWRSEWKRLFEPREWQRSRRTMWGSQFWARFVIWTKLRTCVSHRYIKLSIHSKISKKPLAHCVSIELIRRRNRRWRAGGEARAASGNKYLNNSFSKRQTVGFDAG